MGMKFLNKKGWHTGSLRNIENVWKAEQKDEAEKRKLDELRKQIAEERERDEFRQLQVEAGFAPRQERLEFLYDSGLSVGKTSSEGFSALQSLPPAPHASNSAPASAAPSSAAVDAAAPGALFEEKPQSANDAWRKLHSDPLLMIRQREQEALAQIKNNPVKMAMIRKSVEAKKKADEAHEGKRKKVKSKHKRHSSSKHQSDTEDDSDDGKERKRNVKYKGKEHLDSDEDSDREKRHRHSQKGHGSEKRRQGSPVKRKPDGHEGRERQEIDEDLRERTKDHRHSRRDYGRENGHGSPVKQRTNRNEGRERRDIDDDSREKTKDHRHSGRDYRTEKGHESPIMQKASRNQGRERLDDEDLRDRSKDHRHSRRDYEHGKNHGSPGKQKADRTDDRQRSRRDNENVKHGKGHSGSRDDNSVVQAIDTDSSYQASDSKHTAAPPKHDSFRRRGRAPQLSEEERAARLREMQMDAEVHEEQRWKRLKKAEEEDAREASKAAASASRGKSFLDDAHKSVYGAEKGGSSTIEESVRRRSHYLQGRTQVDEHNAFRR